MWPQKNRKDAFVRHYIFPILNNSTTAVVELFNIGVIELPGLYFLFIFINYDKINYDN